MRLDDLGTYVFPWNLMAWFAVTVSLLALIFLIGAIIDTVGKVRLWWLWRRDVRRRNDPFRDWRKRGLRRKRHNRDDWDCAAYVSHVHLGPIIFWKGKP